MKKVQCEFLLFANSELWPQKYIVSLLIFNSCHTFRLLLWQFFSFIHFVRHSMKEFSFFLLFSSLFFPHSHFRFCLGHIDLSGLLLSLSRYLPFSRPHSPTSSVSFCLSHTDTHNRALSLSP